MIKYIKTNDKFFEFVKKYKDTYNFIRVKPLKNSIKVEYEKKS